MLKKTMNKFKPVLTAILILTIFFNLGSSIFSVKNKYLSNDIWGRYEKLKNTYEDSQYVNKNPKGWIPDEPVNTYAGLAYVTGTSPILIAPDTPPLGRYLIGLSALIFNNENIITILAGATSLIFLYLLGMQLLNSTLKALMAPFFISFEPLFRNQFVYTPLLDIIQLAFLLAFFYFFNLGLNKKNNYIKYFITANILLGCFISTKFFITGITLIGAALAVLIYNKDKKRIIGYLFTLPIALLVLLLTYIKAFFDNPDIFNFLGIQKWVYLYHKSQLIHPFSIWPFIYLNKWYVWWGNTPILSESQWLITWPTTTSISLLTSIGYFFKKITQKKEVEILIFWILFYLIFFSIGQFTARYLVILLPVLYLISMFGIINISPKIISYIKNKK